MDDLKLKPGETYLLKVTDFKPKYDNSSGQQKIITKSDQQKYELYHVRVEDASGKSVLCEYACLQGLCKPDTFVVGVQQYIRCGVLSKLQTPEIEPGEMPGEKGKDDTNPPLEAGNAYALKIQGSSFTFAMGFAKDLKAAEIGQQAFGYKVTPQDLQDVVDWADKFHGAFTERFSF